MNQQKTYEKIRYLKYKELRNNLRSKRDINNYIQLFRDLNNCALFIKETLKMYENFPQVRNDKSLLIEIKQLNKDIENILPCIQTLSEFFTQ